MTVTSPTSQSLGGSNSGRARALTIFVLLSLTPGSWAQCAVSGRRALVIGNADYKAMSGGRRLVPNATTAIEDSKAVAAALEGVGFRVTRRENLTVAALRTELPSFVASIQPGEAVAFVYFGH